MILCKLANTMQTVQNIDIFSGRFRECLTGIVHQVKRKKNNISYQRLTNCFLLWKGRCDRATCENYSEQSKKLLCKDYVARKVDNARARG